MPTSTTSFNLPVLECKVSTRIPTKTHGTFRTLLYKNTLDQEEHIALVYGPNLKSKTLEKVRENETNHDRIVRGATVISNDSSSFQPSIDSSVPSNLDNQEAYNNAHINGTQILNFSHLQRNGVHTKAKSSILTRLHSSCFTGETLFSCRCDCADQLYEAMSIMNIEGEGVIVYLKQEGRGIGLLDKLKAYNLQDLGHDTVTANVLLDHPPDSRDYTIAALILKDLGIEKVRLMTNNPLKINSLERDGIVIEERLEMIPSHWRPDVVVEEEADSRALKGLLTMKKTASTSSVGSSSDNFRELDGYIIAKVEKMNHLLEIPLNISK
ncbi:GTP cyclohydrolase II [Lobulomyces angularis]|nr:GTP cyclohydrolase II [Lobulomyces angularis]